MKCHSLSFYYPFCLLVFSFPFFIKKRNTLNKKQIHDYENGVEKPIDIVLLDKDLTELAAEINKNQSLLKEDKLSIIRREHHLKETISNISHDLRTPLTSLIGYLQLLHKTNLTGEQEEYLNISVSRVNICKHLSMIFMIFLFWKTRTMFQTS